MTKHEREQLLAEDDLYQQVTKELRQLDTLPWFTDHLEKFKALLEQLKSHMEAHFYIDGEQP